MDDEVKTIEPFILAPEKQKSGRNTFLFLSAIIVNLITLSAGTCIAYTSPVIPKLNGKITPEANPLDHPTTPLQESWIAGLTPLSAIVTPILSKNLSDKYGKKNYLLAVSLVLSLSFLMAAFSKEVYFFYLSRILMGLGLGSVFAIVPGFLAEISENKNRGTVGCTFALFLVLGILFSFSVGPFCTVRGFSLLCLLPLTLFFVMFLIFIPDTPVYYAKINNLSKLTWSLKKFRHDTDEAINNEARLILKNLMTQKSQNQIQILEIFKTQILRKSLIISLGLISFQQLTGNSTINYFLQSIFLATSTNKIPPEVSSIIAGLVQLLSTLLATLLVDRLGRRVLLLVSTVGVNLSLVGLGLYFYLLDRRFDVENIFWLPTVSLIFYIVFMNVGLGPLPFIIPGELFPGDFKGTAQVLTAMLFSFLVFVMTFGFRNLAPVMGLGSVFWLFAGWAAAGSFFVYKLVPETKGVGGINLL